MIRLVLAALMVMALCLSSFAAHAQGQATEPRLALVIGNAKYRQRPLATSLNNAALVAEALRSVGFDVTEGAELKQADLLDAVRKFAAKVEAGGPRTIAFVYFSGYGFSLEGENLLVAADALLERDTDVPLDTIRLSEVLDPLAHLDARAKIVAVDASRALPFAVAQEMKLAPGLAAISAPPGMLVSFAAAPGALAADGTEPYGAYALAIAEMVRIGGLDIAEAFMRVRLRVHQLTRGLETPWDVSSLAALVTLAPPDPAAPPPLLQAVKPMRGIGADAAYGLAIQQDTLADDAEFSQAFPSSAYTPRIRLMMRVRREAMTWLRARETDTAPAYWTYLKRYPEGLYVPDTERRLQRLSEAARPPQAFNDVTFADVPPPVAGEPRQLAALPAVPLPPARMIAPQPAPFANLTLPLPAMPTADRSKSVFPPVRMLSPVALDGQVAPAVPTANEAPPAEPAKKRAPATPRPKPAVPRPPAPAAQSGAPTQLAPPPAHAPAAARPAAPRPAAPVRPCAMENGLMVCR